MMILKRDYKIKNIVMGFFTKKGRRYNNYSN